MANRSSHLARLLAFAFYASPIFAPAQAVQQPPAPQKKPAAVSRYLQTRPVRFELLVPAPPASGSAEAVADLAAVHAAQARRTPDQIKDAQRDDQEESIFIYSTILGPRFAATNLPLTAALSQHLRQESSVINPALKIAFNRPRPFVADTTVMPVCERTSSNSYPSGHAMVGYLEGFALAQMMPEDADAILRRADNYAHNRIVCGVHYPSDVEASHVIAAALFAAISTSEVFQEELAAARAELRRFVDAQHSTPAAN